MIMESLETGPSRKFVTKGDHLETVRLDFVSLLNHTSKLEN